MNYKPTLFTLLACFSAASCLRAQQADGPPVNVNSVLATLNQIKKQQQSDIKTTETALAQELMNKASNPGDAIAYYTGAVFDTQFNGLNHEAKELQDWKKRHEADFKDVNFKNALCLNLMYLSLTISHDSGVKTKDLLPTLVAYTQQVLADQPGIAGQEEFMQTPLPKNIFVRWLQIGQYVTDDATWELIPANVDDIYTKVILPEYRREKNADAIFEYWNNRILREETLAADSKHPLDAQKFNKETRPGLLWQRAEEYVLLGQKNNAITAMVDIIKNFPYHPNAPAWIDEVEKMIKSDAAAAAAAQAASASAAQAAAPPPPTPTSTPANPAFSPAGTSSANQ